MAIGGYSIVNHWWLLMVILLMVINFYSIISYRWLLYVILQLLVIIVLEIIVGYYML
jgi:hypothetical protein